MVHSWPTRWFLLGGCFLVLEFFLKYWSFLYRYEFELLNIPNFVSFNVVYVENRHSAFGMLRHVPDWLNRTLLGVSVVALGAITYYQATSRDSTVYTRRGIFCFIVGAIGNMVDRCTVGAVVDYIDISFSEAMGGYTLAWNISDLIINFGFAHLLYDSCVSKPAKTSETPEEPRDESPPRRAPSKRIATRMNHVTRG